MLGRAAHPVAERISYAIKPALGEKRAAHRSAFWSPVGNAKSRDVHATGPEWPLERRTKAPGHPGDIPTVQYKGIPIPSTHLSHGMPS